MRNFTLIFCLLMLVGCKQRIDKTIPSESLDLPTQQLKTTGQKALWFATSNFSTGGRLGRIDLETGSIARNHALTGVDVVLVPDRTDSFFVLSRMNPDGIAVIRDRLGKVSGQFRFPPRTNAQGAARDQKGRVWVTSHESNQVLVLDSDLKEQVGSVDLSVLKLDAGNADLSQIVAMDSERMAVTAQRLHRTSSRWKPDSQSGLAFLNTSDLKVESSHLLNIVNPIAMQVVGSALKIVGAGDYTSIVGANATVASVSPAEGRITANRVLDGKIVAMAHGSDSMIVWHPMRNQSCIESGGRELVCVTSAQNDGFVFTTIQSAGDVIFVSYTSPQRAELWVISISGAFETRKVLMDLPIQSLTWGP